MLRPAEYQLLDLILRTKLEKRNLLNRRREKPSRQLRVSRKMRKSYPITERRGVSHFFLMIDGVEDTNKGIKAFNLVCVYTSLDMVRP